MSPYAYLPILHRLVRTQRRCGFVVCTCCFCANPTLGVPGPGRDPWWGPLRDSGGSGGGSDGAADGAAAAVPPPLGAAEVSPGTAGGGKRTRSELGKRVLCQLAETNGNRELSRRAMRVVNTLRLAQHERAGEGASAAAPALRLMAFDEAYSPRNLVLVGAVAQC